MDASLRGLKTNLWAFAIAAAAIGFAVMWLNVNKIAAAGIAVAAAGLGGIAYWRGMCALSGDRPRPKRALNWLECAALLPAALGSAAGAIVILIAIKYAPAKSWSEQTTRLVAAGTAAVTTYLTTALVKGAEQADKSWIGAVVKKAFQEAFPNRFDTNSDAAKAVFSEVAYTGWGRRMRRKRVKVIERAL